MISNRIGLVLAHKSTNYGALLQSYATQQIVESFGFTTSIISHKSNRRRYLKFDLGLPFYILDQYINKKSSYMIPQIEPYITNQKLKKKKSDVFRINMLHDIRICEGYAALVNEAKLCCGVLIGSDQMWVPGASFGNHLSLRFVPDDIRKISYATSLGVSKYPLYCHHSAKKMWERIDFLSVREEQGKNIINAICPSAQVQVVCDPTYLLTKEEWLVRIPFEEKCSEKYIICYFLGNAEWQKLIAKKYANEKRLKLITLLSDESHSDIDLTFADEVISGASPEDFINWIRGSEYVFTDSFHGLAFSIINEKQFFIFYRKRDDAKQSRNSRIDNIIKMWGVERRLIPSLDNTVNLEKDNCINYEEVTKKVAEKRRSSLIFLENALTF